MTAEFAVALPGVLLTLAICAAGIQIAGQQVRLQDAAADAARSLGRGDGASTAASHLAAQVPHARMSHAESGETVCVTANAAVSGMAGLLQIPLEASSCALGGGR